MIILGAPVCGVSAPADGVIEAPAKFLGEASCSSSSCHGGAGEKRSQCLTFSKLDFHSVRPYATLTTRRSAVIGEALQIKDPVQSPRCTVCHAPFQTVPVERLSPGIDITKGLSCENCHGPAENWVRSHTRPDFTHADRVHSGMRDLRDLYVRANTCVACHQNVEPAILGAGHPELVFEMDGQNVTQPKHWREPAGWAGPKSWAVGQAAALREMSWQLSLEKAPPAALTQRWAGLAWLLQAANLPGAAPDAIAVEKPEEPTPENLARAQRWADALGQATAAADWKSENTQSCLKNLANTAGAFRAAIPAQPIQARRAERLVLALDRLVAGLGDAELAARLDPLVNKLFKDAQSVPGFHPDTFAAHLEEYQKALTEQAGGKQAALPGR